MGYSAGSKRVTLAQVAERAGVSVMTASYTYNQPNRVSDQARSKVLAAAAQLGYAGPDPKARSLRRGSTLYVVQNRINAWPIHEDPGELPPALLELAADQQRAAEEPKPKKK